MTTCNCIGPSNPGCCRNRWFNHYHYSQPQENGICYKCIRPHRACACKDIQVDKDKQQYDLVLQLEKRLTELERKHIDLSITFDRLVSTLKIEKAWSVQNLKVHNDNQQYLKNRIRDLEEAAKCQKME